MTERRKWPLWAVAASMLLACGAAYTGGRVYGQSCMKTCVSYDNDKCVYSGSTGQILKPSNCLLLRWGPPVGATGCFGSVTRSAQTCVGESTYCYAPGSGEYSEIGCGACSGSTTLSCCSWCM